MTALWWVLGAGSVGIFLLALALILAGYRHLRRSRPSSESPLLLALGLPPGSIRGLLAIILVGIFVVVVIGGVVLAAQGTALSDDNQKFYLSVVAPLGTLAAAAAAFYFGAKSVQAAGAAVGTGPTAPLGVTDAEPRSAKLGDVAKITVHGSGFDEDTRFLLRHADDGKEIAAKETTIHNSQVATAQFDLTGATPGSCHLVATEPTGERVSLRYWFTIEE